MNIASLLSEAQIKKQITDYLSASGMFWSRRNVGAVAAEHNGKKRFIRFSSPGEADLWGLTPEGQHYEIEVKRPGGKQSPSQKLFESEIKKNGGVYILADSLDPVMEWVRTIKPF